MASISEDLSAIRGPNVGQSTASTTTGSISSDLSAIRSQTPAREIPSGFSGIEESKVGGGVSSRIAPEKLTGLAQLLKSPFTTGIGTFGEFARREEGVAASVLAEATKTNPSLRGLVRGATQAITGSKVLEFGDVLKQNGVDSTSAAIGGLVMSAFLPSTFLLAGGGRGATVSAKQASDLATVISRSPNSTRNPMIIIAANFLNKDSRRVKQLVDNIDQYKPALADVRQGDIVSKKIQRAFDALESRAPDVLGPSKNVPFNIANRAIDTFDETFKRTRVEHRKLINQLSKENPDFRISSDELVRELRASLRALPKSLTRGTDVPGAEILESKQFFVDFIDNLSKKKGFNLKQLVNMREDLGNKVRGSFQVAGQPPQVNSSIESLTKTLRRKVSNIIHKNFDEIAASDSRFVVLGDVNNALTLRSIRKKGPLGNLLKAKDINAFKTEGLIELDSVLPNNLKTIPAIAKFGEARTNSLSSRLKAVGLESGNKLKNEKAVRAFDLVEDPIQSTNLFRELHNEAIKINPSLAFFDDLARHDLARSFSKAGSVFKAQATAGLVGSTLTGGALGSAFGPAGAALGAAGGAALTIPPVFAGLVKGGTGLARGVSRVATSAPSKQAGATILRKLIQTVNRPD